MLLEPARAGRAAVPVAARAASGEVVVAAASRMAGSPVVERNVLESVAERVCAAIEAGGRGSGLGGLLHDQTCMG